MDIKTFDQTSAELVSMMRETDDPEEKAILETAWWNAAVDVFNTEIAGEITTVTGRKITIPTI